MSRTQEDLEAAAARVLAEGAVPLSELAARVPSERGKKTHASTLVRWVVDGKGGVFLDACRLGGKGWLSSEKALARFAAAQAARALGQRVVIVPPLERERRARAAAAELDRLRYGSKGPPKRRAGEPTNERAPHDRQGG